jgi:hypothetical protein
MSNTNSTGLPPPTIQARNGGTPAEAAYNDRQQQNTSQHALIVAVSKGGAVTIPVLQTSYKTTGSSEQSPTGIAVNNGRVASQGNEYAKYDNQLQQGGKRCKRGGNPDWLWGCYSGGRKRKTRTNKRKTRRYRKKTRRNKK